MNLADFDTLADAKLYTGTECKLIHRDTMNSLLAFAGLYVRFKEIANESGHPFRDAISAFLDSEEYNFMTNSSTGQKQIAFLDTMIGAGLPESSALASIKPTIIAKANATCYPFAYSTECDFQRAKGTVALKQVNPNKGWLKITLTADCEEHQPWVYADIQGVKQQVTVFKRLGKSGSYLASVPAQYSNLFVEDAYGVVG
jgi:hypothetical protein